MSSKQLCLERHSAGQVQAVVTPDTGSFPPLAACCQPRTTTCSPSAPQLGMKRQRGTAEGWETLVLHSHCITPLHSNETSGPTLHVTRYCTHVQ